jgi:TrmH family RNA methyltransferase
METIGRGHAVVRRTRGLIRDRARREADGLFVAEGLHLAGEALLAEAPIESALLSPRLFRSDEGREIARGLEGRGAPLFEIADTVMGAITDARSPQPVVLVVRRLEVDLDDVIAGRSHDETPLVVIAHALQDPGNLGTIVRTAHAAGATGLVATGDGADLFHPKTVRATMGSIFRLPLVVTSLSEIVAVLRERGVARVGTDAAATEPYDRCDLTGPVALFFGRESAGLPADAGTDFNHLVQIPMTPQVESLSVSAAAAILLYEAHRQRTGTSP